MPSTSVSSIRPSWPLRTRLLSIKVISFAVDRAENIGSPSAQAGRHSRESKMYADRSHKCWDASGVRCLESRPDTYGSGLCTEVLNHIIP